MIFLRLLLLLTVFFASPAFAQEGLQTYTPRGVLTEKKESIGGATPEQIEKALNVTLDCKKSSHTSKYFDCDCMGLEFLKRRINGARTETDFSILMKSQKACPNPTDLAGSTYIQCTSWAPISRPYDYKEFCECFATEVALQFKKNATLNELTREYQMTEAHTKCDGGRKFEERIDRQNFLSRLRKNGLYKTLFPGAESSDK